MSDRTKISVAVITYNQENTIRQTLDSILCQKGNFDLELVIGEDCSSDHTLQICNDYAERYPNVVKLLHNTGNLGIMANFAHVIHACTGDYISNIAGDDYYCDDHALEKQLFYFQEHPEVGVMAANGYSYYVQRNEKVSGLNSPFESEQNKIKSYYFSHSHFEGACLAPVGMMYRAALLHQYIDFDEIIRRKLPVEDYPIQAILSQHTHFACLSDLLVTYRVYKESASFISYSHPRYLEYYNGLMNIRRYLNELFPTDAFITEKIIQEKMFYKEFLYDVYHGNYRGAKKLIASVPPLISNSESVKKAKLRTSNFVKFMIYHFHKKLFNFLFQLRNKYEYDANNSR